MDGQKLNERLEIFIDPETLDYKLQCENTYLEDIYIVLRELIYNIEHGDVRGIFSLEDSNGEQASPAKVIELIDDIKQKLDGAESDISTYDLVRDFRD